MIRPSSREESNTGANWDTIHYQCFDSTGEESVNKQKNSSSNSNQPAQQQGSSSVSAITSQPQSLGTLVRTLCEGGCEGVCVVIGTLCATSSMKVSLHLTLLLGFSILSVMSVCLAIIEFISFRAQSMYMLNEYLQYRNQLENHRDVSLASVVHILTSKGVKLEDAEDSVQILSKYEEFFLEDIFFPLKSRHVMTIPAHKLYEVESQLGESVLTFFSVLVFGSLPLVSLVAANSSQNNGPEESMINYTAFVATSVSTLLILGALKNFYYEIGWCRGATSNLVMGVACAIAGALPGTATGPS